MEKKETAKEKILRVASDLFYREGIRAVGIDRIILESGVAKASFYRSFATKDDLVVEYLDYRHNLSMSNLERARLKYPESPNRQLRFLMEDVVERMKKPDYRGCPFMNTAVEFPEADHPGHARAVQARNELFGGIAEIARAAGAKDPVELAEQLRILYSGAIMVAYMNKTDFKPEYFAIAAQTLLDKQLPSPA